MAIHAHVPQQTAYKKLLSSYLDNGGESALTVAYELGRRNLQNGTGLLELAEVHQKALDEVLGTVDDNSVTRRDINRAASRFLSEAISPFEVARLSSRNANDALIKLYEVFESEAKRIAHRLHDESAQMLAVVYLELAEIAKDSPDHTAERILQVVGHLDEVSSQLRSLSHELRPIILDRLGLLPALRALVNGVRKRSGLIIDISGDTEGRLDSQRETVIYRTVQEALTNVSRHAKASHVDIHIWRDSSCICCSISDNGNGMKLSSQGSVESPGLGLIGIKERARALGGDCEISSCPESGTTLQVMIPL
ncbi:MAG: phosphatase RsbU N-terminal domain-containing protein [Pseudohongiella sp.]|nr:phosphatase RsbU N-terminal domain-containing protein [Pseudohongiella sp.]